jgi:hypothetical protein
MDRQVFGCYLIGPNFAREPVNRIGAKEKPAET